MSNVSTILRVAFGLLLLAILLPLFVWIGLAAVGFAIVTGLVMAIASRFMMTRQGQQAHPFARRYAYAYAHARPQGRNQRTHRNGVIIDHE